MKAGGSQDNGGRNIDFQTATRSLDAWTSIVCEFGKYDQTRGIPSLVPTMEFNKLTHAQIQWFHQKYVEYVKELSCLIAHYGNPWDEPTPWYVETDCEAYIANDGSNCVGFFIVGWGEKVDDDVDSEILELTVFPAYRRNGYGRLIAWAAYRRLWDRCGWQVYRDNTRGLNFWNAFCRAQGIPVLLYETVENQIPVMKYRVRQG